MQHTTVITQRFTYAEPGWKRKRYPVNFSKYLPWSCISTRRLNSSMYACPLWYEHFVHFCASQPNPRPAPSPGPVARPRSTLVYWLTSAVRPATIAEMSKWLMTDQESNAFLHTLDKQTPFPFPDPHSHHSRWPVECDQVACCVHCASIKETQEIELLAKSHLGGSRWGGGGAVRVTASIVTLRYVYR